MNLLHYFVSKPMGYQGYLYGIIGAPETGYRFTLRTLNGSKLITSPAFNSVVQANQAARAQIELACNVLGVDYAQ